MGLVSVATDAAKAAGFSGNNLVTIVAIGGAESGWVSGKHNNVPPDDSYGIWQINMYGKLGPARRKLFGITSNDALYNPVTNAKCAWVISNHGTNFGPWTTYTSGKYKEFLAQANDTIKNPPKSGLVSVSVDPNGPLAKITDIPSAIAAISATFVKIAGNASTVLIAVVLLAIGVLILMRSQVGAVVAAATPVGKAASVVGGVATIKANPDIKPYTGKHR